MEKVWFITGSSRGIGAALVQAALAAGDRVVATARDAKVLAPLAKEHAERLLALDLDVTRTQQIEHCVREALGRWGRVDVLVNNAGYGQLGLFEEVDGGAIRRQFETNVFGLMETTRAVLPTMRTHRSGWIFNLSSIGGVQGFAGASAYCAAKFAVEGFTESIAPELAPFGIKVVAVEPGFTRTDFLSASSIRHGQRSVQDYASFSAATKDAYDGYDGRQPGDPARLANLLVHIAQQDAAPLHLPTGSDAVKTIRECLRQRSVELEAYASLAATVDGER
jgi:NAD(P)-dependent dehydrogenase (short-subunit alcohol dehydrogenase family)